MHKLMIKKYSTTWEVPLLKDKFGGGTLCANVYGETFYAPTFKDGAALAGCIETPLVFMKYGDKYRVYTFQKVRSGDRNLSTGIIWNDSGRSLYVSVEGTYTWTRHHTGEKFTNDFSFDFTLEPDCIARIVPANGEVRIENVVNDTTIKTYSEGNIPMDSTVHASFAAIN